MSLTAGEIRNIIKRYKNKPDYPHKLTMIVGGRGGEFSKLMNYGVGSKVIKELSEDEQRDLIAIWLSNRYSVPFKKGGPPPFSEIEKSPLYARINVEETFEKLAVKWEAAKRKDVEYTQQWSVDALINSLLAGAPAVGRPPQRGRDSAREVRADAAARQASDVWLQEVFPDTAAFRGAGSSTSDWSSGHDDVFRSIYGLTLAEYSDVYTEQRNSNPQKLQKAEVVTAIQSIPIEMWTDARVEYLLDKLQDAEYNFRLLTSEQITTAVLAEPSWDWAPAAAAARMTVPGTSHHASSDSAPSPSAYNISQAHGQSHVFSSADVPGCRR
ncbi:hypothetical protein ACH4C6_34290 [Streptomyces sp. NPDC017943]|uniref:hypothetical protein n=1 Tax=Streptomyces sp. NPDC017943 TaxID=3365019 RepID=UPI00379420BF